MMKLKVQRTSGYSMEKPCVEAFADQEMCVDRRTFKTPEEHDKRCGGSWFSQGSNHRIEGGGIARDMGMVDIWSVEFSDLDALMAFVKKYGQCVIEDGEIEIYDTYRE